MKRRSFLGTTSLVPLGFCASASAHVLEEGETNQDKARAEWQKHEKSVHTGRFVSNEGLLRLDVTLIDENDKVTEKIIQTPDGKETRYTFEGEFLPRWLHPRDGIIKRFRFFWNNKEILIPKRFWNDFGGCHITQSPLDLQTIAPDLHEAFKEYQNELSGPQVILSADGGTALIEWVIIDTDACCGHRATMRWMISKQGHVMRHRHTTPNPC